MVDTILWFLVDTSCRYNERWDARIPRDWNVTDYDVKRQCYHDLHGAKWFQCCHTWKVSRLRSLPFYNVMIRYHVLDGTEMSMGFAQVRHDQTVSRCRGDDSSNRVTELRMASRSLMISTWFVFSKFFIIHELLLHELCQFSSAKTIIWCHLKTYDATLLKSHHLRAILFTKGSEGRHNDYFVLICSGRDSFSDVIIISMKIHENEDNLIFDTVYDPRLVE